jgi:hypothetical protein
MAKTLKELLEARFVSSGAFRMSASGRKIRRRIKIGDDDYNKEDDLDKDGDVDKDDAKLAKRLRWESFSSFAEGTSSAKTTVNKASYSWGKMVTVHHGKDTSYPLHPEHQEAIKKLKDGEKTSFKDETNSTVHAHREGDSVHLTRPKTSSTKTTVAHSHFNEETINEYSMEDLHKDAAASLKKSIDKQSDDRIAALKNPPKKKSFLQRVGEKQINMVKGAYHGLTKEDTDKGEYDEYMKESLDEAVSSGNAQHALANSELSKHAAYMKQTHGVETKYHGTDELSYHGDKASVKKALINHYDDEGEAKALHPKVFKESLEEKRGLWDNIHAKQERIKNGSGEKMRKPGSKGAPTAADFKNSQSESYAPVAPVPDKKYIKGTPEHKANKAAKKPINGHPTNVKEESIVEHDEHGPDHVEIALDHRTPPKNQKAAMATLKAHGAEYVATSDKATHFKVHKDKAYRLSKELRTHGVSSDIMESKEEDPPFDKPYKTVPPVTKDKSGAEHTGMSRARHIARLAMKQAAKKAKA